MMHERFIRLSLVAEMLLPSDCLNIDEFRAIHINYYTVFDPSPDLSPSRPYQPDRISLSLSNCLLSIPLLHKVAFNWHFKCMV